MYPNLKLQLWRSGLRQNRLAQMVGIHESLLSKIVNGFREPDPRIRTQIAAILNSDEGWLFTPGDITGMRPDQTGGNPRERRESEQ
ncbi:MAG TPA: helix-turn-helix transcriptional regulator [Candidatus Acidoferrum sp.]|jgi:transcriptional regulator with XRE-family HTH domain|nr:helix-turn-helix transcriptional regulator [Candidatus Acidoferrum sp.]